MVSSQIRQNIASEDKKYAEYIDGRANKWLTEERETQIKLGVNPKSLDAEIIASTLSEFHIWKKIFHNPKEKGEKKLAEKKLHVCLRALQIKGVARLHMPRIN